MSMHTHTHTHTKTKTTLLWIHIRMLHNVTLQSTHLHWKWWERHWVKCCSVFVYVISTISLCIWFCTYSADYCFCFIVHFRITLGVSALYNINTLLHYITHLHCLPLCMVYWSPQQCLPGAQLLQVLQPLHAAPLHLVKPTTIVSLRIKPWKVWNTPSKKVCVWWGWCCDHVGWWRW